MIAAHRVEGYGHHVFAGRLGFHNFNHFAAFIDAAVRTRAVRANFHMAIGTFAQMGHFQGIVGPAC
jgi:hypothetical protein